jgi:hypothetical protein
MRAAVVTTSTNCRLDVRLALHQATPSGSPLSVEITGTVPVDCCAANEKGFVNHLVAYD